MNDRAENQALRPVDRSVTIALLQAREATMRLFKPCVDAAGLTLPQWRVLRALADGGPRDAGELAEDCVILPPSISRILATLETAGLIERSRESADARRRLARITDAGAALVGRIAPDSEARYRALESAFGAERLNFLLNELSELRQAAAGVAVNPR